MEDENKEQEMSDVEIAELANKELKVRDAEIAKLKKELAKSKLYSVGETGEEIVMSKEDCVKILGDSHTTNYDYWKAVLDLVDNEKAEGRQNPLGKDGEAICEFIKGILDECDGDKNSFTAIYQARIGSDDPTISMAYNRRK